MATKHKAIYLNGQKTTKVRMAFAHIFQQDTGQYGQNKYKAIALLPQSQRDMLKDMKKGLLELARKAFPNIKWGDLEHPFKDGNNKPDWDGFPEHEYFGLKSKKKPIISQVNGRDAAGKLQFERCDESDIKSGDYVRFGYSAFTYLREKEITKVDGDGNETTETRIIKGVSLILESVLKVAEGEGFGGGSGAASMDRFDDDEMADVGVGSANSDNPDNYAESGANGDPAADDSEEEPDF